MQDKYMKTMTVRDRIVATYRKEVGGVPRALKIIKVKRGEPSETEIEVEHLKRRLKEDEDQLQLYNRKIEKIEEEGRLLERGYISTHNKLLQKQLKLAEINAENNVLHNRIERLRALSQSLMSGDSISMYRAYIVGLPDIGAINEDGAENEGIEGIIRKKEQRLMKIQTELDKVKEEVTAKRRILEVGL